jgi:crotonobetainyl-CoA:carnitine CoA-transferase CaiB-like acyl-CoA transferase
MNSIDDILADEHLTAIEFLRTRMHPSEGKIREIGIPTEWSCSQPAIRRHAPTLGEHSVEILQELGFSEDVVKSLLRDGIVKTNGPRLTETGSEA